MREKTKDEVKRILGFNYDHYDEEYYDVFTGKKYPPNYYKKKYFDLKSIISDVSGRLKKLEIITNANDIEIKKECKTKLVKKT